MANTCSNFLFCWPLHLTHRSTPVTASFSLLNGNPNLPTGFTCDFTQCQLTQVRGYIGKFYSQLKNRGMGWTQHSTQKMISNEGLDIPLPHISLSFLSFYHPYPHLHKQTCPFWYFLKQVQFSSKGEFCSQFLKSQFSPTFHSRSYKDPGIKRKGYE